MALFLTKDELIDLTGYRQPSGQCKWLRSHGYFVELNARGIPRITYEQVHESRRQKSTQGMKQDGENHFFEREPNSEALRKKISTRNLNG
jgi:hypothetical protein